MAMDAQADMDGNLLEWSAPPYAVSMLAEHPGAGLPNLRSSFC